MPRTLRYATMRACERLDPRAFYGRAFLDLAAEEQVEFLAFVDLRDRESAHGSKDVQDLGLGV